MNKSQILKHVVFTIAGKFNLCFRLAMFCSKVMYGLGLKYRAGMCGDSGKVRLRLSSPSVIADVLMMCTTRMGPHQQFMKVTEIYSEPDPIYK